MHCREYERLKISLFFINVFTDYEDTKIIQNFHDAGILRNIESNGQYLKKMAMLLIGEAYYLCVYRSILTFLCLCIFIAIFNHADSDSRQKLIKLSFFQTGISSVA